MGYNICFVCTGNACRSPFAECVMKKLLVDKPQLDVEVWSCGTLDWGRNPRDSEMVAVAAAMGCQMDGVTTYMSRNSLLKADLIIGFEQEHYNMITRELDYSHWNRVHLFGEIAGLECKCVEDPHYQSAAVYKRTAELIEQGCRNILAKLLEDGKIFDEV